MFSGKRKKKIKVEKTNRLRLRIFVDFMTVESEHIYHDGHRVKSSVISTDAARKKRKTLNGFKWPVNGQTTRKKKKEEKNENDKNAKRPVGGFTIIVTGLLLVESICVRNVRRHDYRRVSY